VRILDDSGTRLLCGARTGIGVLNKPLSFHMGEGVIGWVVANRSPALVQDAASDPRFKQAEGQAQGFPIQSLLAVPLWAAGKVVGVLGVSSSEPRSFSDDDEVLARLLANCASPYIEKARVERLSITDLDTLAFNRRYLIPLVNEEFERARRNDTPLSLLLIDIDQLEQVVHQHGQAVANRLLLAFADRLRASIRLSDSLVRYGSWTFVLVMPDMEMRRAAVVAERIRHSMKEYPMDLGEGLSLTQTISVGVASWDGGESAEGLVSLAKAALEEASALSGNRTIWARRLAGRQLGADATLRCPRSSCNGQLEEVRTLKSRTYFRCSSKDCQTIWCLADNER
jgi:diguanylate cyclase (GGDEF)-like protein